MGTWTNSDGLYIRFGADEATLTTAGEYPSVTANMHVTEVEFDLVDLGTAAAIQANTAIIPSGATISKVEILMDTAATSAGSAALNVGLIRLDRSTAIDADGLVAALALASIDADGDVVELVQGSTGHGALVGTVTTNAGLITADYDTAAFTAGHARVRVYWYVA